MISHSDAVALGQGQADVECASFSPFFAAVCAENGRAQRAVGPPGSLDNRSNTLPAGASERSLCRPFIAASFPPFECHAAWNVAV